ncbi:MAG TPA: S41 family peptidase [Clostridiales bacterium]|nr:S41 family peptidase [Clostridiales bacterium]
MNKKVSLGAAIAMMFLVAAITFSITYDAVTRQVNSRIVDLRERESAQAKYAEIDREVRANYYGTIDETQLLDSVARGYLAGIGDQYATYYDAKTYEKILRSQENTVADIGAVLRVGPDGYLVVEEVYPDSPAAAVGIKPGDQIIKIDDVDLTPENSAKMKDSVQGEQGTRITLTIRSDNVDRTEELTRRVVVVPSVTSRMLGDSMVGYLIITEFNANTSDQFKREVDKLINQGAQSLIFDLRDNKGGLLSAATRILDRLLPAGPIVSSMDREGNINVLATSDATEIDLPMVVLINSGTASSAEVFAQALKDYGKARVVGTTSTGKGVMQTLIRLSDGSAIEITTATLVTPRGETFNGVGVRPDYEVAMDTPWKGLGEELDPQLKKAMEVAVAMHRNIEVLQEQSQPVSEASNAEQVSLVEEISN